MDKNRMSKILPKVSVIIPVYNTEAYVREAVESIMHQTLTEIEIIIINDGSTDNSLSIVEKLADEDNRIRVFSQKNQGQSAARNLGLKQAKGKYLYFMDSDDLLDTEALALCYEKNEKDNLDFVLFDAESFYEKKEFYTQIDYKRAVYINENKIYNGILLLNLFLDKRVYNASVCLNLIRKETIDQIKLSFYSGIIHEDELFTAYLYSYAKRVGCIHKSFYKRRFRKDSTMTSKYSFNNIKGYLKVIEKLIDRQNELQNNKEIQGTGDEETIEKLIRYIINPAIYNAHVLPFRQRIKVFVICVKRSYSKYIRSKSQFVLLFPISISIKARFK